LKSGVAISRPNTSGIYQEKVAYESKTAYLLLSLFNRTKSIKTDYVQLIQAQGVKDKDSQIQIRSQHSNH
jgi:hypothetical protein